MFTPHSNVKAFLALTPVDMRLSFDRLAAITQDIIMENPASGHLFIFHSRRRDRVKILYWDGDGYALWYKRLEAGTFAIPRQAGNDSHIIVTPAQLTLLLAGIDLNDTRKRKRWSMKK